jgi:hypothetical protein
MKLFLPPTYPSSPQELLNPHLRRRVLSASTCPPAAGFTFNLE